MLLLLLLLVLVVVVLVLQGLQVKRDGVASPPHRSVHGSGSPGSPSSSLAASANPHGVFIVGVDPHAEGYDGTNPVRWSHEEVRSGHLCTWGQPSCAPLPACALCPVPAPSAVNGGCAPLVCALVLVTGGARLCAVLHVWCAALLCVEWP
jgi:hypothetical protein